MSGRQAVEHNEFVPSCSESLDAMAADVDGSHLTVHTVASGRSIISDQSKPTLTMRASCSALTKWLLLRTKGGRLSWIQNVDLLIEAAQQCNRLQRNGSTPLNPELLQRNASSPRP